MKTLHCLTPTLLPPLYSACPKQGYGTPAFPQTCRQCPIPIVLPCFSPLSTWHSPSRPSSSDTSSLKLFSPSRQVSLLCPLLPEHLSSPLLDPAQLSVNICVSFLLRCHTASSLTTRGESFFVFVSFFAFSRATLEAFVGSQVRCQIGAVAARLYHIHSNSGSESSLRPIPQLTATLDP